MFSYEMVDDGSEPVAGRERSIVRERIERLLLRLALFASFAFIAVLCFR